MKELIQHHKYIAVIIIFFAIFLGSMAILYPAFTEAYFLYDYSSLDSRLEHVNSDEEYNSLKNMAQDLLLDYNWEPEFDKYWEFAKVESYYMQATAIKRALDAGDTSVQAAYDTCIETINAYIEVAPTTYLKKMAISYITELQQ